MNCLTRRCGCVGVVSSSKYYTVEQKSGQTQVSAQLSQGTRMDWVVALLELNWGAEVLRLHRWYSRILLSEPLSCRHGSLDSCARMW